ncbi:PepSY domain-containing protein [Streptomyces spirodelae]|uniref:PepSY domain-containing protein n=1 Tax=Streptomyces spirodelae TaxID=2812904 RepID=A0ABS3WSH2_9ACTN|nr:PepSY domain-containing protein [Streptomyces spirodelae]MBO8185797.1 PepSY domain-containing protein [Streptomyces spirodelae]
MKRKVIIATVAAAALVGGGTATAFGVAGHGGETDGKAPSATQSTVRTADHGDDHDDDRNDDHKDDDGRDGRDGGRSDRAEDTGDARVSFGRAAHSVLKEVPGSITELELDTEGNRLVWEADVLGKDNKWHDVKIDAIKGNIVQNRIDRHHDDDRSLVRHAELDAAAAGKKAAEATKGTVTSVSLDDDGKDKGQWEAETADKRGTEHELALDGASGKVLHHETEQADDEQGDD